MGNSRRYFETRAQQQAALGSFRERLHSYPFHAINEFYRDMNMRRSIPHSFENGRIHPHWRSWMENQRKLRKAIKRKLP